MDETLRNTPKVEEWKSEAKNAYKEMREKGLLVVGVVVARKDEKVDREATIRVRIEEGMNRAQIVIAKSMMGESTAEEEAELEQIETTWRVWREESEKQGDASVRDWMEEMWNNLFGES